MDSLIFYMDDLLFYVCCFFAFLFGITIGSFLNVCIYRLPQQISVAQGRSFCPQCHTQLKSTDLVPILSFLFLKGRCRYCQARISWQYPLVELLTGILYLIAFALYPFQWRAIVVALFFSVLLVIAFIDYQTRLIYDRTLVFILCLVPFYLFLPPALPLFEHVLGAFIISVPMFLLAYCFNGFGGGDVKLVAVAGLFLGWKLMLITAFLSVISCGMLGLVLLASKKADRKTEIPFGPFLSAGMILAMIFGQPFWTWYASLLP